MRQQVADYRLFWREFRQAYHTTGAVLPSGPALCRALARYVRDDETTNGSLGASQEGRRILEVGPGTGAVTLKIAAAMKPADRLVLVERNDKFVEHLKSRLVNDPLLLRLADRVTIVHESIERLPDDTRYDVIVSGLPLNNFSVELVEQILTKLRALLMPGGTLSFFEYVAIRRAKSIVSPANVRHRLRGISQIFSELFRDSEIRRDLVMGNVPPAWVHHLRFEADKEPA